MFLQKLAKHIIASYGSDLSDFCFVFPNRRSGLFFKRFLLEFAKGTSWSPRIVTINELMQQLSDLKLSDSLDLLFDVYDAYKSYSLSPESFDKFYTWGETMLTDFDNLDKYQIDVDDIFQNISELKEIDEKFGGLDKEQIEFIRTFWSSFHMGEMSKEKNVFLHTWKILPKIYKTLKLALIKDGYGYEGMIYRSVAEMEAETFYERLGSEKYFFIGFNALNDCEKALFLRLSKMNRAAFYWDYDLKYIVDDTMEAGRFLRENLRLFPAEENIEDFSFLDDPAEVRIFDLPSDVLQSKMLYSLLTEEQVGIENPNDTAIVACDENLLMPLLHSLPERVEQVNITMGYPFKNTPLNSFVEGVLEMILHAGRRKDGEMRFYHKDVLSVLNHQYFRLISETDIRKVRDSIIKSNRIYVDASFFQNETEQKIFRSVRDVEELCAYLNDLLRYILRSYEEEETYFSVDLEKEYVLVLLTRLNKLTDRFVGNKELELSTFVRLFKKMTTNLRIPFAGEPLAGLQLMGILETRLLDFRHVVMLSVNEDVMPKASAGNSFIPYSLRYAFGLPVREDMDAIYAYYFYRILQRAEKVDLLFNSSSEGVKSGEMSRYLYQLKYEYGIDIHRPVLNIGSVEKQQISVKKTPEICLLMDKYLVGRGEDKYLSPSALNTYIECSLKFYLRNLAGIGESDDVLEELDAIGFGNILHETMYRLYLPFQSNKKKIHKEDISNVLKGSLVEETLLQEFRKEFYNSDVNRVLEGRNLIIFEILKKYVKQVLKTDAKIAPFEVIALEEEIVEKHEIEIGGEKLQVRVGGKIDRVDRPFGENIRIIDYKTGNSDLKFASLEKLFDSEIKKRNKEAFQALCYSMLYKSKYPEAKIVPGLYVTRKLFEKDYKPNFEMGHRNQKQVLSDYDSCAVEYSEMLNDLLNEIFNKEMTFSQTEDLGKCRYCDFKLLCQR